MREIELSKQIELILEFIGEQLSQSGFEKLIIGLSGGIDSAVTAALCVKAIGAENVYGVMLPYRTSRDDSLEHAILLADQFKIKYEVTDISPMVDAYLQNYAADADILRKGNRMARERMCVLYDLSTKYKALVAGTGNKSELMIGYCTQYGDSACAFEPLGHLYKTEVKLIAAELGIPEIIINKNPTADLWEDQTDEDELGITYAELDEILYRMLDEEKPETELRLEFGNDKINKVNRLIQLSVFKRNMPPILKL